MSAFEREHDARIEAEVVKREIPAIVEAGAKDGRDWFIAYIRQGFSEEQAMAMVTRAIYNVPPPTPSWWKRWRR